MPINKTLKTGDVIGIFGGGQLARMMCFEAAKLGFKTLIYADQPDSPAFQVSSDYICADYQDKISLAEFARKADAVTFEFENIPVVTLEFIAESLPLRPNIKALAISQNRVKEKEFFNHHNIKTAEFTPVASKEIFTATCHKYQKAILKTAIFGYDGKGQYQIDETSDLNKIWSSAVSLNLPLILEKKIAFEQEVSIIAARSIDGKVIFYDLVENFHQDGILKKTIFPARTTTNIKLQAETIALQTLEALNYVGVLAIEFFLQEGNLLVNEFAPRPHNSGHFSLDACLHSQFEQAIRAAAGMSVIESELLFSGRMVNLIGSEIKQITELHNNSTIKTHHYGKLNIKEGRKMGHYIVRS